MFKCALVKPIGLLSQHAAEEMALNGFRGLHVCLCVCLSVIVKGTIHVLTRACLTCGFGCAFVRVAYVELCI